MRCYFTDINNKQSLTMKNKQVKKGINNDVDQDITTIHMNSIKYLSVNQFCRLNNLPIGGVRFWLFNRATNGFSKCVRKVGKKIYISQSDFLNWMEEHRDVV